MLCISPLHFYLQSTKYLAPYKLLACSRREVKHTRRLAASPAPQPSLLLRLQQAIQALYIDLEFRPERPTALILRQPDSLIKNFPQVSATRR